MPKLLVCYLFIFSLLFLGIESAVDASGGEHPHGDDYAHVLDSDNPHLLDSDADNGHCSHCCHGHSSSIAVHLPVLNCDLIQQQLSFVQVYYLNYSQAPPTPPPTV